MTYWETAEAEASARIATILGKPYEAGPRDDGCRYGEDDFNPWDLLNDILGCYSAEFDICAIEVLTELRDRKKTRQDLGAEMFREMLCANDYCDYGTSPRYCFWIHGPDMLDQLIERWKVYYEREWGEPYAPATQPPSTEKS